MSEVNDDGNHNNNGNNDGNHNNNGNNDDDVEETMMDRTRMSTIKLVEYENEDEDSNSATSFHWDIHHRPTALQTKKYAKLKPRDLLQLYLDDSSHASKQNRRRLRSNQNYTESSSLHSNSVPPRPTNLNHHSPYVLRICQWNVHTFVPNPSSSTATASKSGGDRDSHSRRRQHPHTNHNKSTTSTERLILDELIERCDHPDVIIINEACPMPGLGGGMEERQKKKQKRFPPLERFCEKLGLMGYESHLIATVPYPTGIWTKLNLWSEEEEEEQQDNEEKEKKKKLVESMKQMAIQNVEASKHRDGGEQSSKFIRKSSQSKKSIDDKITDTDVASNGSNFYGHEETNKAIIDLGDDRQAVGLCIEWPRPKNQNGFVNRPNDRSSPTSSSGGCVDDHVGSSSSSSTSSRRDGVWIYGIHLNHVEYCQGQRYAEVERLLDHLDTNDNKNNSCSGVESSSSSPLPSPSSSSKTCQKSQFPIIVAGDFNSQRRQDYTEIEWTRICESKARRGELIATTETETTKTSFSFDGVAELLADNDFHCCFDFDFDFDDHDKKMDQKEESHDGEKCGGEDDTKESLHHHMMMKIKQQPNVKMKTTNWLNRLPPATHWSGTVIDYAYHRNHNGPSSSSSATTSLQNVGTYISPSGVSDHRLVVTDWVLHATTHKRREQMK